MHSTGSILNNRQVSKREEASRQSLTDDEIIMIPIKTYNHKKYNSFKDTTE